MRLQLLSVAAVAAAGVSAQTDMMNLTSLLSSTPSLSNLTTYVSQFPQLLDRLGSATNITILAPSNAAFEKFMNNSMINPTDTDMIEALLQYHVLNGTYNSSSISENPAFIPTMLDNDMYENITGGQVVEAVEIDDKVCFFSGLLMNSTVTKADNNFTGGVVHIVDSVLTLPLNISTTAIAANLTSLAGALTQAKLVDTVDGLEDVTVFAPNNAAFRSIGSALPNLTDEQITSILTYHVVNGTVGYSADLSNGTSLMTMQGGNVTITMNNDTMFVNDARVVVPNVLVSGGVVHVIDNVLNPENSTQLPSASATSGMPAFSGASSATEEPFTSGVPTPTTALGGGSGTTTEAPGGGGGGGGGGATASGTGAAASTSGLAAPMRTGVMGPVALFGGVVVVYNL